MLSERAARPIFLLAAATSLGVLGFCVGCGNAIYAVHANAAEERVQEARQLGAEELAPYEYYYAKAHLEKAASEAAQAEYGNAADLAEISEEYANKAVKLSREARRGAGR
jgi:hypothetical protein